MIARPEPGDDRDPMNPTHQAALLALLQVLRTSKPDHTVGILCDIDSAGNVTGMRFLAVGGSVDSSGLVNLMELST